MRIIKEYRRFVLTLIIFLSFCYTGISQTYFNQPTSVRTELLELKDNNKYTFTVTECLGSDTINGTYIRKNDTLILNPNSKKAGIKLISYDIEYSSNNKNLIVIKNQDSETLYFCSVSAPKDSYKTQKIFKSPFTSFNGDVELINTDFDVFLLQTPENRSIILPLPTFDNKQYVTIIYNLLIYGDPNHQEERFLIKRNRLYYIDHEYEVSKKPKWKKSAYNKKYNACRGL